MRSICTSRGFGITLTLLVTCLIAMRIQGAAESNLNGTVLDQTGAVIAGAPVDLYSEKHEWHTTTDAAGRFSFSGVLAGMYDLEVTRVGFRKIIQSVRIDSSEPAPMTITMLVASTADSCRDSFSTVKYVDENGESALRGVVDLDSQPGVTGSGGQKPIVKATSLLSGITISILKSGSKGKPLTARPNEKGEFNFDGLEPGLYSFKVFHEDYGDFGVSNVRVRPGKILQVRLSMQPPGSIVVCQ